MRGPQIAGPFEECGDIGFVHPGKMLAASSLRQVVPRGPQPSVPSLRRGTRRLLRPLDARGGHEGRGHAARSCQKRTPAFILFCPLRHTLPSFLFLHVASVPQKSSWTPSLKNRAGTTSEGSSQVGP